MRKFFREWWASVPRTTKHQWLTTLVAVICSVLAAAAGTLLLVPPVSVEVPVPAPGPPAPPWADAPVNFGWVDDPAAVEAVADQLRFRVFSDTPAGQVRDETLPTHAYLWQAYLKVTGGLPPVKDQGQVGSCVSFGTNNAIMRSLVSDLASAKKRGSYKDIAEEVTYGGSRVQVGGGKIRGDGSVGAWAAEFVRKYGVVPRETVAGVDLSRYDQSRCKKWGDPPGPPAAILDAAKLSPVKEVTQVKTWSEAKKALAQGYAIAVCSQQGFSMKRDQNGVSQPSGSWAHCMCLDGYHVEGVEEYGHITNSWGADAHKGPVGWGSPNTDGFWAKSSVVERMLRQGDSWAFSGVVGFPAREIDWFVQWRPAQPAARLGDAHAVRLLRPDALFAVAW